MDLKKIKQVLFDETYEKVHWNGQKSDKYYHGERVAELVLALRKQILPNDNSYDDILTVAAWFHDIMHGAENHAKEGAEKAKELLSDYCSEYEMREIYGVIYTHDDRNSDRDSFSVYAKIQQDADFLDHIGFYDIWLIFTKNISNGETILGTINDMNEWVDSGDKWHGYGSELNFEISKKIYKEKMEFYRLFAERFSVEGVGKIWGEI